MDRFENRMKKFLFKAAHAAAYIGYLFAAAFLTVLALEGLGRLYVHARYGKPGKSYGLFTRDAELPMVHRPNSYNSLTSLNNYGFRNQEDVFDPKPANGLRIITFGGSTTFGYNLKEGETFQEQMEKKIRQIPGYERTQVLNAGEICYSAGQSWVLMKRFIPKLKPDYVIIYEGVNEAFNAAVLIQDGVNLDSLKTYGVVGKKYSQANWLLQHSVLMRYLDYKIKFSMEDAIKTVKRNRSVMASDQNMSKEAILSRIHPWIVENFKIVLAQMIDFSRQEGAVPVIVRYDTLDRSDLEIFSDLAEEVAKEKKAPVVDMRAAFKKSRLNRGDFFIYTGCHMTALGANVFAEEAFEKIMALEAEKKQNPVSELLKEIRNDI